MRRDAIHRALFLLFLNPAPAQGAKEVTLHQSAENFWEVYRVLVKRLLRPLGKSDGYPEKRVSDAERRLGRQLPHLLREFYLITGERKDINGVHNRLLAPEDLRLSGDVLVFYEENQGVCLWGVDVRNEGDEDPAVFREDSDESPTWDSDFDYLSQFLIAMLFMQAVNGGMRHGGIGSATNGNTAQAPPDWEAINLGGSWNNRVLMQDGQVLYIFGNEPAPEVFGGAKTKQKLLALEKTFGVSWDYCTLDDE